MAEVRGLDFTQLANYTPYILILGGLVEASWLLQKLVGLKSSEEESEGGSEKAISVLGFFVGVLLLATGGIVWWKQAWDLGTRFLLLVAGLAMVLKPLKDVPWAALVALVVGGLCAGAVYLFLPLPDAVLGVSSAWIYLVIFLVPALFAYLLFKFVEDMLKLIAMILAFKPVATVIGLTCVIQGILLLLNSSLFTIL